MKRLTVCLTVLVLAACAAGSVVSAQEKGETDAQRDALINNLNSMRNQEIKVAILQQLLNDESAKLLQMQAIFSDQYNLVPEKLRSGMYTYDQKEGRFIEKPAEPAPQPADKAGAE